MSETFKVVVTGLRFGPDRPKIEAAEIASPLRHYGFEGVTVTPMDDALIEAAEAAARTFDRYAELHDAKGTADGGLKAVRNRQEAAKLRAAVAKARGDTK